MNKNDINEKLFKAAINGDDATVQYCIDNHAKIDSQHTVGATAVFAAASYNRSSTVKLLIKESKADLEITANGMTPLYKSARECHHEITEILLKAGANKEAVSDKYTPLYAAISSGCIKDVQLLLEAGAKTYTDNLDTPILLTSYNRNESPNHQIIYNLVMDHYWKQLEVDLPNIKTDSSKTFEVVVVRYQEDLSWLTKEFKNEKVIIYNKGEDDLGEFPSNYKIVKIPNVGWFGGTILYHLANSYDNLADRTLFLQGDPYAQHLFLPLIRYKDNIVSKCYSITANCIETTLLEQSKALSDLTQKDWDTTKYASCFKLTNYTLVEFVHDFISRDIASTSSLSMVWGAQFAVDKNSVWQHGKIFYQKVLSLFDQQCPIEDFMLEKAWNLIFDPKNFVQLNRKLFEASWAGDNQKVIELVEQGGDINGLYDLNATPVYGAAKNNQTETVKLLISKGADLEIPINTNATPLYAAAFNCNSGSTKLLIDAKANQEITVDGWTPFWGAIYSGCSQNVEYFLEDGSEILWDQLRSPLYTAAKLKDESPEHNKSYNILMDHYWKIVENYPAVELTTKLEVVVVRYKEDLHWIISEFKAEKVIVYNKGPDDLDYLPSNCEVKKVPNVGWFGGTILHHIVHSYDHLGERTLFLQGHPYDSEAFLPMERYKGALNSTCNNIIAKCEQSTLLYYSNLLAGNWSSDQHDCFSDPKFSEPLQYTLIEFVHKYVNPHYDPTTVLNVDLGAQFAIDAKQVHIHAKEFYESMLPFFNSTRCSRADYYIEKVWDIVFQPKTIAELNAELFKAATIGDNNAIKHWIAQGADVNSRHSMNATSIYIATQNQHISTVQLLVDENADVDLPLENGATPFYRASYGCSPEIAKILLQAGANVTVAMGHTPLYAAINMGCLELVKINLDAGADLLADEKEGELQTPILMAVFSQCTKTEEKYQLIYDLVMNHYYKWLNDSFLSIEDNLNLDKEKTFEVVVSRYNENLSWIAKEFPHEKVTIYNKGADDLGEVPSNWKVIPIDNIGYLGGTYLKHIVDNYHQLADRTLFLQGDPYDAKIFLPLISYKGNIASTCKNIIAKCLEDNLLATSNYLKEWFQVVLPNSKYKDFSPTDLTLVEFTHQYIDSTYPLDKEIYVAWGAEFAVDKDKILSQPKVKYEAMLPLLNKTKPTEDFFLEQSWDQLFSPAKNITQLNRQLFEAAWAGNNTKVIELLDQGAYINGLYDLNATPVYGAAKNNKTETVELLVSRNASLDIPLSTDGATALYAAAFNCHTGIVKILLDAGAKKEVMVDGYSPLFVSIYSDCPKQNVEYFLQAGAVLYYDVVSSQDIHTPLFLNSFKYNQASKTPETDEIYSMVLDHYYNITADQIKELDQKTANSSRSFEVVVVRYKEELSWINKEFPHEKVTIYNKGPDDLGEVPSNWKVIPIDNIGYLGGTYLKHIVDNYNHLADRTMFMQGHPYDANVFLPLLRHKDDVQSYCKNIIATCGNSTLAKEWNFLSRMNWDHLPSYKLFEPRDANMIEYAHKYIGNIPLDETIYVAYGAIFAVDKEKILNCPREHYEAMLPEFDMRYPMADHYQERLWDLLFEYCIGNVNTENNK